MSGIGEQVDDEDSLQEYLSEKFTKKGWDVEREVRPDGTDYRVDLLLNHQTFGPIGVETKYVRPGDSGMKIARGLQQITEQYWNQEYNGEKVLLWAICPHFERLRADMDDQQSKTATYAKRNFIREFFCQYGIGFIKLNRYATIDYGYSVAERKIPGFAIEREVPFRHYKNVGIENIRESVREKRGVDSE